MDTAILITYNYLRAKIVAVFGMTDFYVLQIRICLEIQTF